MWIRKFIHSIIELSPSIEELSNSNRELYMFKFEFLLIWLSIDVDFLIPVKFHKNSVQPLQRRSRKCLSQSEVEAAIFSVPISPKNFNFVEDIEFCLPVKFCQIPFCCFREAENVES